jgi:hypothetical protein
MLLFDALEAINQRYNHLEIRPIIEAPVNREGQINDIKNYKRQYYLKNLNTYKERNRLYRERMKEEKTLENLFCNFEE